MDAGDLAAADSQLDAVLDDWVQDNYGGRFEVLKTVCEVRWAADDVVFLEQID